MSDGGKSRSSSSFHFLAGLSSGVLSAVLLQPADLLKTRVQQSRSSTLRKTLHDILRGPSPLRQLWRGTVPSALRTGFGSALYFTTLNALRQNVARTERLLHNKLPHDGAKPTPAAGGSGSSSSLPKLSRLANLLTGAAARASAGFVMMPVTVIKVRFESSYYAYRTLWGAARDIFQTHGARGFFAGFGATAVRDAPYAGLYVLFYEESKRAVGAVVGRGRSDIGASGAAGVNFVSGLVAAGLGTALTNPFDAIKTRIQLLPDRYGNMAQAVRVMVGEEGVRSLFDGLGLRIARKALSSALAWTLYEELIRRAERKWVKEEQQAVI